MVLAMPVQGLAASLMLFCGPGHSHTAMFQAAHAPGHASVAPCVAHGQAHDPVPQGHVHAVPGGEPDAREVAPPDGHDGAPHGASSPQPGAHSCSACAACCAMQALPACRALPGAVPPAHPTPTFSAAAVSSLPPDGLERPPRASLA